MRSVRAIDKVPDDVQYPHVLTRWISTSALRTARPDDTAATVLEWSVPLDIDIIPVGDEGQPLRTYLVRDELSTLPGSVRARDLPRHEIALDELVAADSHVTDALEILTRRSWVFTFDRSSVVGIMTRGDLQHPLSRMFLFGVLTRLELHVTSWLRGYWQDDEWLERDDIRGDLKRRARSEWESRSATNEEPLRVVDCLSLPDKLHLLTLEGPWRQDLPGLVAARGLQPDGKGGFPDALRRLRNNVAHAHDLTSGIEDRWATILQVVALVQDVTQRMTARSRSSGEAGFGSDG